LIKLELKINCLRWPPNYIEAAFAKFCEIDLGHPSETRLTSSGHIGSSDKGDPLEHVFDEDGRKDSESAWGLICRLRREHQRRFTKILFKYSLRINSVQELSRERHQSDDDVRAALATINDRVGFLHLLDETVEGDREALFRVLIENSYPDNIGYNVDSFAHARIEYDNQREQEVCKMLKTFFCEKVFT